MAKPIYSIQCKNKRPGKKPRRLFLEYGDKKVDGKGR